jgi:tRNA (guanine-N7-)-methyltransferase
METHIQTRPIRSFVRREGRLTPGQKRAMEALLPRYGIELTQHPLDFDQLFGNGIAVTLEVGFGNGESLAQMAQASPERGYIGIEVHRPGVGHLLQLIEQHQLSNLRIICADALEVFRSMVPAESLDTVQLFFPDPWPKKRHHKRRIINLGFTQLVAEKLKSNGTFHIATDWANYAETALEVIEQSQCFENLSPNKDFVQRPMERPVTKFEQRGQKLGHSVWDLMFRKRGND